MCEVAQAKVSKEGRKEGKRLRQKKERMETVASARGKQSRGACLCSGSNSLSNEDCCELGPTESQQRNEAPETTESEKCKLLHFKRLRVLKI